MNDVYQIVTDRILSELEKGVIPWKKPWKDGGAYNLISGRQYSYLNQLLLGKEGPYVTFNQVSALGGKIRRGEKAHTVVFWKIQEEKMEELENEEQEVKKKPPILKRYSVFHISQTEGIEVKEPELKAKTNKTAQEVFDAYIKREGILLNLNADQAFYSPATDSIHLPRFESFENESSFWCTAFHEAGHSTGNHKRLNREAINRVSFGSRSYSYEELIAEMTASFIGNRLDFLSDCEIQNSASYIDSWLGVLKHEKKMVVYAASKAEKAAKFILNES